MPDLVSRQTKGPGSRNGTGRLRRLLLPLLLVCAFPQSVCAGAAIPADVFIASTSAVPPRALPLHTPQPVALTGRETLYATLSVDGRRLVTVEKGAEENELWLYPAAGDDTGVPRRLLTSPARLAAPALSANGRHLLYVDARDDVKGDIWLLDLEGARKPRRLTGRESEDDAPAFAADGQNFFYHALRPGARQRHIVRRSLAADGETVLPIGRDAAFPAPSPDGRFLAFCSQADGRDHLWLLEIASGELEQLTSGARHDLYPAWEDGRTLLFARVDAAAGTDGGDIYRLYLQRPGSDGRPAAYPLTAGTPAALQPKPTPGGFLFVAARAGVGQVLSLPAAGEIPACGDVAAQWLLAQDLLARRPLDLPRARLACARVQETEEEPTAYGAAAALALAGLDEEAGDLAGAALVYAWAREFYRPLPVASTLAEIGRLRLQATLQIRDAQPARKRQLLVAALAAIDDLRSPEAPEVTARALIDGARLLADFGTGADAAAQAIDRLDQALRADELPTEMAAEAAFRRAVLVARLAPADRAQAQLVAVAADFAPSQWGDAAVAQVLERTVELAAGERSAQIRALAAVAEAYRSRLPTLAMAAWNRIGDLYFADDEWARAKNAYRTVLDEFALINGQSAAARFALAEILYREERYGEAVALYEQEMARRVDEDHLYQQARRAYIGKTLAAGENLYRLGEVAAARRLFLDLIRYDDTLLEAHRGYVKAVAAEGQAAQLLAIYRQRLLQTPKDGTTLYAAALCQTYLPGAKNLRAAEDLLAQAAGRLPESEYVPQTRGYVAEVLETVHGEAGGLERALAFYRRAHYLNRGSGHPENRAHLELNIGNVAFLLGQYATAYGHFERRLASEIPFDHPDTEYLFYQRYGAAAFQVHRRLEPVAAYRKALQLIEARLDPGHAAELLSRLVKTVNDRLLRDAPAGRDLLVARAAQEAIAGRLALLGSRPVQPPPAPEWSAYAGEIGALLAQERAFIAGAAAWAGPAADDVRPEIDGLAARVEQALAAVPRLVENRAELLDRLGLACQEAELWSEARTAFEAAFSLSSALGRTQNLARNRRSAAFAIWRAAEAQAGEGRRQLLLEARAAFAEVLELLGEYPPAPVARERRQGRGLVNVGTTFSLDETKATAAAYGFSAAQEKRLAKTFLARIDSELGRIGAATEVLEQQLAAYPADDALIAVGDRYGVALLAHRLAHLRHADGDAAGAYAGFLRSARLCIGQENPLSAMLNVVNAGELLPALPADERHFDVFLAQAADAAALADRYRESLPGVAHPAFHNAIGVYLLQAAERAAAPRRQALLQRAVAHFGKGLQLLREGEVAPQRSRLELRTAVHLNRALAYTTLGLTAAGAGDFELALAAADRGLLPGLAWRALAGLGRYQEAWTTLQTVPVGQTRLVAGELSARFAPWLAELTATDAEAGLALVEALAERERVEMLAPSWLGLGDAATGRLLAAVADRLATIDALQRQLATAKKEDADYQRLRLGQEEALVGREIGTERERLPAAYREVGAAGGEHLLRLAAAAGQVEAAAEAAVAAGSTGGRKAYEQARIRYRQVETDLHRALASGDISPLCRLAVAETPPVTALMDRLPGEQLALRLVELATDDWLLFTIGAGGVEAERLDRSAVENRLSQEPAVVAIFERPDDFAAAPVLSWGISASQLVRALDSRQPFRRRILDPAGVWPVQPPFEAVTGGSAPIEQMLPLAHTLLLPGPAGALATVPTRAGETAGQGLLWRDEAGTRRSLTALAAGSGGLGLWVAPAAGDHIYILGHLGSLLGIPSLLVPKGEGPTGLAEFFPVYAELPAAEAAAEGGLLLVGDWGLDAAAAADLAVRRFADLGRAGVKEHNAGRFRAALAAFENALTIAEENRQLAPYRTMLHRYGRESAFAAGDLPRAVSHAEALVAGLAQEKPFSPEHADALLRLGILLGGQERFAEAADHLAESIEMLAELGETAGQAQALADFGAVMENATDYGRALSLFEEAASVSGELGDRRRLAEQYRNLGRIHDLRLSQYGSALQLYRKAQQLYAELALPMEEAESLLEQGRCQRLLGNFPAAARNYEQALALLPATGGERTRARIVLEQANNAWFQGNYQLAFDLRQQAEKAAASNGWALEEVIARNTGGLIWWTLGDNERALLELQTALGQARKLAVRQDEVATTLNNIGLVQREMGRLTEARRTLEEALAIDRRLGSRWAIAYDLRNLALTDLRQGDAASALPRLEEALALTTAIGNRINQAKVLLALGDTRRALGEPTAAEASYRAALALADAMFLREVRWRALAGLAALATGRGERPTAIAHYDDALATIEEMRAEIRLDQLKDGFLTDKMDVYAAQVGLLADSGRIDEAFAVAERSRARSLIDLLGQQRLSLAGAVDRQLYEAQLRLKEQIREQEALAAQASTEEERAMYAAARQKLQAQYKDLLLEIERQNPQLLSLVRVQPLTVDDTRRFLDRGVVLLTYYQLPDRLLCWRLTADSVQLFRLPVSATEVAQKMTVYRRMLQNLEPLERLSGELYRSLLAEPLRGIDPAAVVGIVPHGSLHYLAFATLSDGRDYFIDRHSLFYLPSASVLRFTTARRAAEKNGQVLAIGNPDLGDRSLDLPFAEREAATLRWNYPEVTLLTRERATESWVRENIGRFGIIHLASHGEFDPVNPLFSAVRLARDGTADGSLEVEEIFGLSLRADLVVLSACQTGLGDVTAGDDVIGMNRAFLFAGTHALVSSLWRVSDVSTAVLMKQFYRDYTLYDKAASLRRAMLHVKNRYPHPGYWGAFTLIGDYR